MQLRQKTLVPALIAAMLALGSQAAQAFDFENTTLDDFTLSSAIYKGSFNYDNVTYTPGDGKAFDLTELPVDDYTRIVGTYNDGGTNRNAIYRIYRQQYSAVVGNILQGGADRSFVQQAVGEFTDNGYLNTLATNTKLEYNGVAFNHIEGTEGTFSYTISNDGTKWVGEGSVAGITGARPTSGSFTIGGALHQAEVKVQADGNLGVFEGSTTLTSNNADVQAALAGVKYDLGVFGPNAEEVAGRLYGPALEALLNNYGLAAKQ